MTFPQIVKCNGRFFTKDTSGRSPQVGDVVKATGWFDSYPNGQRKLSTVIQYLFETQVSETGRIAYRIDGPAGSFECMAPTLLRPINEGDLARCAQVLSESESFLAEGKRVGFGKHRGKPIGTDFQRQAAEHSIDEQRRQLAEMRSQINAVL